MSAHTGSGGTGYAVKLGAAYACPAYLEGGHRTFTFTRSQFLAFRFSRKAAHENAEELGGRVVSIIPRKSAS